MMKVQAEGSAAVGEQRGESPRRDTITFPEGLPGFETSRAFVLLASDQLAPVQRLDSIDGAEASFLVIDPKQALPTFRYDLSEIDRVRLGASDDTALLWLALLMLEPDGAITVNLRAPIVINPERMVGYQVMPYDCLYPLRHVLAAAE